MRHGNMQRAINLADGQFVRLAHVKDGVRRAIRAPFGEILD
jgi:hypothetical protein